MMADQDAWRTYGPIVRRDRFAGVFPITTQEEGCQMEDHPP
jgi:hypothetical protein